MSKLKDMADNPEKTFGTVKSYTNGAREATKNLKAVLTILESNLKIQEIANTTITAWFKGWDGPGDTNVAVVSGTNMSIRRFIGNVINDSQLIAQLFSAPEKAPESKESEEVRQRTRFGTFLLALETRYPSSDYKAIFRQAHEALWKWDIDTTKDLVRKPLKDDWNIDVNSIIDAQWHINALRAIGATDEAALWTKEQVKGKFEKWGQLSSKESALIADIGTNIEREKSRLKSQAESRYNAVLAALPVHDPMHIQVERNKDTMIAQFSEDMAYMSIMDGFVKKNGSEWLKQLGEVYDDMRGLYGTLNFTDENTKMTKEMATMLASFVLTGGAWTLIRGLAAAGRAVAGAEALKAVDVASKIGIARQNIARAGNAGRAAVSSLGNGVVKVAEWVQTIGKIASSTRLWAVPVEALKFTTADSLLRTAFRAEGERSGFEDYFEKFAKNIAMFTAFAGMEKFVSWPMKEKLLWALAQKGVQLNPASTFAVGTTVLTGGDVAAMWGLGMAEKGEFHMLEWKEVFQALAFRIGMKWAEKAFPKIAESIQAQIDKRGSSQKKWSAPEGAKTERSPKLSDEELLAQGLKNEIAAAKRGDIQITPEALALKEAQLAQLEAKLYSSHNQKIEALKIGEQVRFETRNSQYVFERVKDGYKLIETSNPEMQKYIGTTYTNIVEAWNKLSLMQGEKVVLQTSRLKPEPTWIDAQGKLWLTKTREFNHANLNERADFRKTLDNATRGDSVEIWDSVYRRVNNGWQKFDAGTPLAQRDYTQWTFRTTEQVMADWNLAKKPATFKKAEAQPQPEATRSQEQVQYLSDFSSLQLGQKVRVEYQGNIVEGTVARISPNKDSIWIQIGENTRLDGPVGRVKILQDAPLQTAVWKTEGSWVDAKQKLWLTQTKEFNHANLNERADFRKTLDNATRGDSVEIWDSVYRRVNNGWQKFDAGTPLAQRDYTQWTFRTTEQVMTDWNLAKKPATFKKAESQGEATNEWGKARPTSKPDLQANLEKSIAKTEADLAKMRADLKTLQDQLINKSWSNPTARMNADEAIVKLNEQIAKKQADIAKTEKHLAELNANKKREAETPLRKERKERAEELRWRRDEFKVLSPEARVAELDRVKAEWVELQWRRDDYAKNLEANKEKMSPEAKKQLEKDIAELDKKIMANKAQENMMTKLEKDIKKADDDLRATRVSPDEVKKLAETPAWRKKLTAWLEDQRKLDWSNYMRILIAVLAALLLATLFKRCADGSMPSDTTPPQSDGKDPWREIDAACGIDSGKERWVLIDKRKSNEWAVLTEIRRIDISRRYMNTPRWNDILAVFKENESLLENSKFADSFRAIFKRPNPTDIQHIQRWIGMESVDKETAQDGILGPNTAKALIEFMNICKRNQSVPKPPPAIQNT